MMEEHMFLGLRKNEGISISQFNNRFDKPLLTVFEKPIKEMIEKGWLEIVEGYVRLTKAGRFFGNEVFQSFLVL